MDGAGGEIGVIGADDDLIDIRDNQHGRVLQRVAITKQLLISFIQVVIFALILQTKIAYLGNICPALTAAGLGGAHIERKTSAGGVSFIWGLMPDKMAQVDEMLLINLALAGGDALPLGDEFFRSEGHEVIVSKNKEER